METLFDSHACATALTASISLKFVGNVLGVFLGNLGVL